MLEKMGFNVKFAMNGSQALEKLSDNADPDIILMDCQMPVMDGYTATKKIREDMNLQTPIIALTAHALESDKKKCFDSGMDDHLTKPVDFDHLRKTIYEYVGSKKQAA